MYLKVLSRRLAIGAIAALSLAGCAASAPPVEVTRFHAPEITSGMASYGPVTVAAAQASDRNSLALAPFEAAVAEELRRVGFAVSAQAAPRIAEVSMTHDRWQPGRDGSPVSVGVGGSTGSYGSGVGVGLGIDLSGPPPEQVATTLSVTIRDRDSGKSVWEGRAEQVVAAKSPLAQPQASARALAAALFADFPGTSGESYSVKQD